MDHVPTTVISSVLGECHLLWSVLCLPPTLIFHSVSLLCLHFVLFNQIIRVLSASALLLLSVSLIRLLFILLCFLLQA